VRKGIEMEMCAIYGQMYKDWIGVAWMERREREWKHADWDEEIVTQDQGAD
jgi:hypothetical protein